jgi:chromosome segregation ATPase
MDLLPPDLKKKIEEASTALQTFEQSAQKAAQKSKDLADAETDLAAAKRELSKAEGKITEKKQLVTIQKSAVKTAQNEADAIKAKKEALEKFLKTQAAYEAADGDKRKAGGGKKELEGMNLPADRKAATAAMPGLDLKDAQAV